MPHDKNFGLINFSIIGQKGMVHKPAFQIIKDYYAGQTLKKIQYYKMFLNALHNFRKPSATILNCI